MHYHGTFGIYIFCLLALSGGRKTNDSESPHKEKSKKVSSDKARNGGRKGPMSSGAESMPFPGMIPFPVIPLIDEPPWGIPADDETDKKKPKKNRKKKDGSNKSKTTSDRYNETNKKNRRQRLRRQAINALNNMQDSKNDKVTEISGEAIINEIKARDAIQGLDTMEIATKKYLDVQNAANALTEIEKHMGLDPNNLVEKTHNYMQTLGDELAHYNNDIREHIAKAHSKQSTSPNSNDMQATKRQLAMDHSKIDEIHTELAQLKNIELMATGIEVAKYIAHERAQHTMQNIRGSIPKTQMPMQTKAYVAPSSWWKNTQHAPQSQTQSQYSLLSASVAPNTYPAILKAVEKKPLATQYAYALPPKAFHPPLTPIAYKPGELSARQPVPSKLHPEIAVQPHPIANPIAPKISISTFKSYSPTEARFDSNQTPAISSYIKNPNLSEVNAVSNSKAENDQMQGFIPSSFAVSYASTQVQPAHAGEVLRVGGLDETVVMNKKPDPVSEPEVKVLPAPASPPAPPSSEPDMSGTIPYTFGLFPKYPVDVTDNMRKMDNTQPSSDDNQEKRVLQQYQMAEKKIQDINKASDAVTKIETNIGFDPNSISKMVDFVKTAAEKDMTVSQSVITKDKETISMIEKDMGMKNNNKDNIARQNAEKKLKTDEEILNEARDRLNKIKQMEMIVTEIEAAKYFAKLRAGAVAQNAKRTLEAVVKRDRLDRVKIFQ